MCRSDRFCSIAYTASLNSKQTCKHGAVITKNSKIMCTGYNEGMRTKLLNNIRSCIHAEMDVANKLIKILKKKYGNKYRKHTHKYIIWVVRNTKFSKQSPNIKYYESKPCFYCVKDLLAEGFDKIRYSIEDGTIIFDRLKDIEQTKLHKSGLQVEIEQHLFT
jgi:deoxycytidylate deaminase